MTRCRSRRRRAVRAGAALAVALGATACGSGDDAEPVTAPPPPDALTPPAPVEPDTTPSDTPPSDTTPLTTSSSTEPPPSATAPVAPPELGSIDVATFGRLPALEPSWTAHDLDLDGLDVDGIWISDLLADEDGFAVVGMASIGSHQLVVVWRSPDAVSWRRTELELAPGAWVNDAFLFGDRVGLVGQAPAADTTDLALWWSTTDGGWARADLAASGVELAGRWSNGIAVGDAGVLVVARRDPPYVGGALTFEAQGHRFSFDLLGQTYELVDVADGRIVATGSMDEIYPWSDEGQLVVDQDTGEPLATIPWEVWEGETIEYSPLPIPVPPSAAPADPWVVEWQGIRVEMHHAADRVDVIDVATGELLSSSTIDAFHRGPPPRFSDAASGETVATFTWEEWDELWVTAHETPTPSTPDRAPELLALFSPDLERWTATELGLATDSYVTGVAATRDRFMVWIADDDVMGGARLLTSSDGVTWDTVDVRTRPDMSMTASSSDRVVAVTWGGHLDGPSLVTSEDGIEWQTPLLVLTQPDGRTPTMVSLGASDDALAVLTVVWPAPAPADLTVTVDGRTASFAMPERAVEIVDDATGRVLLSVTWDELEAAERGDRPRIVTYADATTTFWSADGEAVMSIPDEAVFDAQRIQFGDDQRATDQVVFVELDGAWYEAAVPVGERASAERVVVGDGVIVVATSTYADVLTHEFEGGELERVEIHRAPLP